MFKDFIKRVTEISTSVANTVFASLAWSGATRAANELTMDSPDASAVKTYLALASLASRVTVPDLRPTADGVIELLNTAPELEKPTDTGLKILKDAGEDVSNLDKMLKADHELAIIRHQRQVARVKSKEQEIRGALEAAFAAKPKSFPEVPEDLAVTLTEKVIQKVQARRSRLIVDISSGRNLTMAPKELAEINVFLKEGQEVAA